MKHCFKGLLFLVFMIVLTACGGKVTTSNGYELVEKEKFIFSASGEFKPFSYMDKDGKMIGFDIEVGEAIAKELGLEPVQKKFKFGSIVEGVKSGRFDAAIASHTITEERLKEVNFSTPYYYSGAQIFVRPDDPFKTLDDLKDKEVAVSRGSTFANILSGVTDNIILLDSDVTALEALSKGKHDAVITDFITGKEAIGSGMKIEGRDMLEQSEQGIGVAKDNKVLIEKINEALETLRKNGTLKEISVKYFGEDITVQPGS
ncbi:transporter substrate-binding domain-containing protein [Bacillus aquiflavi]|uniref:transporter substrate-binding domain-containing protein n=1 Tax=Bacillus aquiflavi TaxID=2672567 RepID=UPI003744143A